MKWKRFFKNIWNRILGRPIETEVADEVVEDINDILEVKDPEVFSEDSTLDFFLSTWPGLTEKQKNEILKKDHKFKHLPKDIKDRILTINKHKDDITEKERKVMEEAYLQSVENYPGGY